MTDLRELLEAERSFLRPYLPDAGGRDARGASPSRPFVTLTYACSLDSMISLGPGLRTSLSGPETKSMTHYLRLQHDAILVGAGTATADDPSLNCRYPGASADSQPRPIILDPRARWPAATSKVQALADAGHGKEPWIIRSTGSLKAERRSAQEIYVHASAPGDRQTPSISTKLDWTAILTALHAKGIDSLMIEGGATIINDLLLRPELVDATIVTIAPTFLGQGGVLVSPAPQIERGQRINAARLQRTSWRQFGQDVVLCGILSE